MLTTLSAWIVTWRSKNIGKRVRLSHLKFLLKSYEYMHCIHILKKKFHCYLIFRFRIDSAAQIQI